MVKIEASVVIKAPRKEVYGWFSKPENWTRYEKTVWTSIKVRKRERNVVTAVQESVIEGKSAKGTFKYTYSPPEKIESVWSEGNYGGTEIRGQLIKWAFAEVPEGTKVSESIDSPIPCISKLFGPTGERKLQSIILRELKEIKETIEKS